MTLNFNLLTCPQVIHQPGQDKRCGAQIKVKETYRGINAANSEQGLRVLCSGNGDGGESHFFCGLLNELWTPLELADAAFPGLSSEDKRELTLLIDMLRVQRQAWNLPETRNVSTSCLTVYRYLLERFAKDHDEVTEAAWDAYCRDWAALASALGEQESWK